VKYRIEIEIEVFARSPRAAIRNLCRRGFGGVSGTINIDLPAIVVVKSADNPGGEAVDVDDATNGEYR
jgi:hypothetical protein